MGGVHACGGIGIFLFFAALAVQGVGLGTSYWTSVLDGAVHGGLFQVCTATECEFTLDSDSLTTRDYAILALEILAAVCFLSSFLSALGFACSSPPSRCAVQAASTLGIFGGCFAVAGAVTFFTSSNINIDIVSWSFWMAGGGGIVGFIAGICFIVERSNHSAGVAPMHY